MRRWAIAFAAVLALVSTQPVVAATFRQGVVQNFADLATANCHNPEGITADAGGTLYAAGLSGNICVVNGAGQIARVIPGCGANGVAFDATRSNLCVANTGDDRIFRVAVNPDGSAGALSIFADGATINAAHHTTGALDGADGIVFDASGRLWVCANQANEIQVLSPAGTSLVKRFSGTGDDAMNFPASPVFVGHAMFVANLYLTTPGAGKLSGVGAAPGAP